MGREDSELVQLENHIEPIPCGRPQFSPTEGHPDRPCKLVSQSISRCKVPAREAKSFRRVIYETRVRRVIQAMLRPDRSVIEAAPANPRDRSPTLLHNLQPRRNHGKPATPYSNSDTGSLRSLELNTPISHSPQNRWDIRRWPRNEILRSSEFRATSCFTASK